MRTAIAIVLFVIAGAAFLHGFVTEWRQSRDKGPVAIVPTLPFALAAALLVLLGLLWLPYRMPWWLYPVSFIGSTLVLGWLIVKANGRSGRSAPG